MNEMDENEKILQKMMNLTSNNMPRLNLKQHYKIIKELGNGSYGHVLLVEQKRTGKTMALKLMKKTSTRKDNFLMEYCVSLCLSSHLNIIGTYAIAFETSKYLVFAQELATVGDLYSIIEPSVGLPEPIIKSCAMQLAEALDFIHSRALVHRDLKLDNILIFDRECSLIKLADFGLTRLQGFSISAMSGTLPYSSPEVCNLNETEMLPLDPSLDVWAFGVLLYCISTGVFPWTTALTTDAQYEEFVMWINNDNCLNVPTSWKIFTPEALNMFQKLLSINPDKRSPAITVLKYLNKAWINSWKDFTNTQENSTVLEENANGINDLNSANELSLSG